jgi:hypothetical protein
MGIVIVFMIAGAIASGVVASSKNRDAIGWGLAGFFLPLISLLILAAATPLPAQLPPDQTRSGY